MSSALLSKGSLFQVSNSKEERKGRKWRAIELIRKGEPLSWGRKKNKEENPTRTRQKCVPQKQEAERHIKKKEEPSKDPPGRKGRGKKDLPRPSSKGIRFRKEGERASSVLRRFELRPEEKGRKAIVSFVHQRKEGGHPEYCSSKRTLSSSLKERKENLIVRTQKSPAYTDWQRGHGRDRVVH